MRLRAEIKQMRDGWRWGRRPLVPASVGIERVDEHVFPTGWGRSAPARAARAAVQGLGLKPLLYFEVEPRVEGLDVLEALAPPVVFVANHSSHLDAPLVLTSLPRRWRARTTVGAAADYFFSSWWRGVATTIAFNAFPVERAGGRRTVREARALLSKGWNILVFPEGTRSQDGWIKEFRAGGASLALGAGIPVVPVAISGAYRAMPRGAAWPAPGRPAVAVRFGRPVRPARGERARDFNERVRDALLGTLDEEETTWWDARSRAARGETPRRAGPDAARWRRVWEASRTTTEPRRAWERRP